MAHIHCDIIIDFQTIDPENHIKIAQMIFEEFEKLFKVPAGLFQIGDAQMIGMGWSVAKLFLSMELAQKLYENNSFEIEKANGRGMTYKFLTWLNTIFSQRGCKSRLKYAEDMKNTSGGYKYSSQFVTIFSDEFYWSR